jgi:hypothetical protein
MRRHLTKEEQALIAQLQASLRDRVGHERDRVPGLTTFTAKPPLDLKSVNEGEEHLGFPIPPLLRELFIQIGNGGFGPGYDGLFRLMGNHPRDNHAIVSTYRMSTGPDVPEEYDSWHYRHIVVAHWGCNIYSAIDCTTADGAVYRYSLDRYNEKQDGPLRDFGVLEARSLREWMESWLSGEEITTL